MKTSSAIKYGIAGLTSVAIIYGINKCDTAVNKSVDATEMVNKFAVKSLIDTFNIKLNKEDSTLFSNYIKEFTSQDFVKGRISDLYKIGRDTNLLTAYNPRNPLGEHRDIILRNIANLLVINSTLFSEKLDSMNSLLVKRLSKYPEYNKFQKHWNITVEKEGYGKLFSKKYIPTKEIHKSKPILKKPIAKARNNLRPR
ncbi:MAG: hypothetical protein WCF78_00100 [archaeon]